MAKTRHQKLKETLDTEFSTLIRLKYMDYCYTCGKASKRLQCGHYISRQYLATRWDETNCRPQCWGCNGYGKGRPIVFEKVLKEIYGSKTIEANKKKIWKPIKLDEAWYEAEIEKVRAEIRQLQKSGVRVR